MKEWIDLTFQLIGIVAVVSSITICIRIIIDKCIRTTFCKHKYVIQGRLKLGKRTILILKCNECGKKKNIEIYDDKFIIELREEAEK